MIINVREDGDIKRQHTIMGASLSPLKKPRQKIQDG